MRKHCFHLLFYTFYAFLSTIVEPCLIADIYSPIIKILSRETGLNPEQKFFVEKITYNSDVPFTKEEFFYLTDLKEKEKEKTKITLNDIARAYNNLRLKNRFHDINFDVYKAPRGPMGAKNIHVKLTANWIFKDIKIQGIWFGKHRYKNLYLHHPGDIFDISLHEESIEAIKKLLHDQGYFNASVLDEITYNKKDKTILVSIKIKAKKQFRIGSAQFLFTGGQDSRDIEIKLQKIFYKNFANRYFSKKLINKFKEQVKSSITRTCALKISLRAKSRPRKINLVIKTHLEPKLLFKFKGCNFFSYSEIEQKFVDLTKPRWLLDPNIIAEQILHGYYSSSFKNAVVRYKQEAPGEYCFYINEGIRSAVKEPTVVKPELKEKKEISCDINGEEVRFGKTLIYGHTKLPFKRIMREIQFREDDLWDREKLHYSRKKLRELDLFKYISLRPKKLSHKQAEKPVIVTLLEDDPVKLKLRAGYFLTSKNFLLKRESTYKVGATLLVRNPLNIADKLSLNTDLTRFEKNFDLDYHIPHLLSKSTNAKFSLYAHQYVHPLQVGDNDAAYEATQTGFLSSITKEYKPHSFWGVNIGNEWMKTNRTRGDLKLSPNMIDRTIPYFFLEPNLVIDNLDDRLNVRKGSFTFCSIKLMIPYASRTTIYKIMLDRSMFYPIYNDIIIALKVRWGHIFRQKFEEIMPIERFYLGGPNSVRGYSKDAVPPLGEDNTIQGGSSMINGSLEIRFPIYKSFGGVLFQDIGSLSQTGFTGFMGRWYPTSGLGLRYHTPIGALRFDIGWKWKKDFDRSYAWYLAIGQCF